MILDRPPNFSTAHLQMETLHQLLFIIENNVWGRKKNSWMRKFVDEVGETVGLNLNFLHMTRYYLTAVRITAVREAVL